MTLPARAVGLGLVLVAALPAAPAAAKHPRALLAHTASGGRPDGTAIDPAMSGDGRMARWASYASTARDIVGGAGTHRNVYLVQRKGPFSSRGTPWVQKRTILATRGQGGPADGDSWGGTFDGVRYSQNDRTVAPRCFAFVSAATNLVHGDGDGKADVFVRRLAGGRLVRLASSAGATEADLDGSCKTIAFVAGGVARIASPAGGGKARAISGPGASSVQLSADGHTATYERGGAVWVWRRGKARRLVTGQDPTSDGFGRYVSYRRGSAVLRAELTGPLRERSLRSNSGARVVATTPLSMTAGGSFVFFGHGAQVDSNAYRNFAVCPSAGASVTKVSGSAQGNYAVYSCSTGDVWITYLGPS